MTTFRSKNALAPAFLGATVLINIAGCEDRPTSWDIPPQISQRVALPDGVALIDNASHSVHWLRTGANSSLTVTRKPVGIDVVRADASRDGTRLYALANGVQPRRSAADLRPALYAFDTSNGESVGVHSMSSPQSGLAIDPEGKYVVVYSTGASNAIVNNPNELIILDVTKPFDGSNAVPITLRSFGGIPKQILFSPPLLLPGGSKRLLVVATDQDISLLDLDHLDRPEITVRLTSGNSGTKVEPLQVIVDDGEADRNDDAHIAIRTANDSNIVVVTLGPVPAAEVESTPNDYRPVVNLVGLGSVPTDIRFVRTGAGLRLAALQPASRRATLVDLSTSATSDITMPASYGRMALVTQEVSQQATEGVDVVLLWGGDSNASGIGFWSLSKSLGQPYRAIEALAGVGSSVAEVLDVPKPNNMLKILMPSTAYNGGSSDIVVLNLETRTASPLLASTPSVRLTVSNDGRRAWLYQPYTRNFASVDLTSFHPQNLVLDSPVDDLFDIASADGGRSLLALHAAGNLGATIFNALSPDEASAVEYVGILQGGF